MAPSERTGPTVADMKRLYGLSGNRCAFPKCTACIIVDGTSQIGEICHIKARSMDGPRYDPAQSSGERHGYANLILLCPNHHKVIDDDEESYTVERLLRMKAEHEAHSTKLADEEVDNAIQLFVDQSVTSEGQSGGVTAHTITIGASPRNSASDARRLQAVESIWKVIVALKNEFADVTFIDTILTVDELKACFEHRTTISIFDSIGHYADQATLLAKFKRAGTENLETERVFVSQRIYALAFAIQAVHGRAATLLMFSFSKKRLQDWREDRGIEQHLRSVLPPASLTALKARDDYSLRTVIGTLENEFIAEAEHLRK